jgi:hypothetical protein
MSKVWNRYSKEKELYIVEQYEVMGKDTVQIAAELNTYSTTIRRVLIRNHVHLITTSERLRKVLHNPFENLSDKDVQYWIGFIAADGNIAKDRPFIRLYSKDRTVLEQYKEFLGAPVNIWTERKRGTDFIGYVIGFTNADACKSLRSTGITPNKSLTYSSSIPITWDFLRGIIDGDGSVMVDKKQGTISVFVFTASIKFATQVKNFYKSNGINSIITADTREFRNNTLYRVAVHTQKSIKIMFYLLYKDARYFLPRKYTRFGSIHYESSGI